MARRDIPMNEVVETIYQWHQGRNIQQISKSLGLDRKTVRKSIRPYQVGNNLGPKGLLVGIYHGPRHG